jgi:RNA polymerase sigma-32 factor
MSMAQSTSNYPTPDDRRFISAAMDAPFLERDHEAEMARRWREEEDEDALHKIITAHIRLVVRIAAGFRGYGLPFSDLIQEGSIGLLQAANRFDTERNVRFSTYASWWILAAIQEHIVRHASIVRIGTTPAQKRLFFNLRRLRARLAGDTTGVQMSDSDRLAISKQLKVPIAAVERMEAHLSGPDRSLNATIGNDDSDEMIDFLLDPGPSPEEIVTDHHDEVVRAKWIEDAMESLSPRERQVIKRRFLEEDRTTLAEIGISFGVTKERVRQIEGKALSKLRDALSDRQETGEIFFA